MHIILVRTLERRSPVDNHFVPIRQSDLLLRRFADARRRRRHRHALQREIPRIGRPPVELLGAEVDPAVHDARHAAERLVDFARVGSGPLAITFLVNRLQAPVNRIRADSAIIVRKSRRAIGVVSRLFGEKTTVPRRFVTAVLVHGIGAVVHVGIAARHVRHAERQRRADETAVGNATEISARPAHHRVDERIANALDDLMSGRAGRVVLDQAPEEQAVINGPPRAGRVFRIDGSTLRGRIVGNDAILHDRLDVDIKRTVVLGRAIRQREAVELRSTVHVDGAERIFADAIRRPLGLCALDEGDGRAARRRQADLGRNHAARPDAVDRILAERVRSRQGPDGVIRLVGDLEDLGEGPLRLRGLRPVVRIVIDAVLGVHVEFTLHHLAEPLRVDDLVRGDFRRRQQAVVDADGIDVACQSISIVVVATEVNAPVASSRIGQIRVGLFLAPDALITAGGLGGAFVSGLPGLCRAAGEAALFLLRFFLFRVVATGGAGGVAHGDVGAAAGTIAHARSLLHIFCHYTPSRGQMQRLFPSGAEAVLADDEQDRTGPDPLAGSGGGVEVVDGAAGGIGPVEGVPGRLIGAVGNGLIKLPVGKAGKGPPLVDHPG